MGLSLEEAAAGMYRVINMNMAQGVREITIKRGFDPREFPLVAAGGAGPLHACMICQELEIPLFIVPRESSTFCAAGMLMSDLRHDFVSSFVSVFERLDWGKLYGVVTGMIREGATLLAREGIPEGRRHYALNLDCRYVKQYHEVSFPVPIEVVRDADAGAIAVTFHSEHQRMYGYALEEEGTPIELINVRVRASGATDKPTFTEEPYTGRDAAAARKGGRRIYIPEERTFKPVSVYDGHKTRHGNYVVGPAVIEQVNTTLVLTASYDCLCDQRGSFVVYRKGAKDRLSSTLREMLP
jgi:N-methylhydantoinase A